jgi:hypothetical protein
VYKSCLTDGEWAVVGNIPFVSDDDAWQPPQYMKDIFTGAYSIYEHGEVRPSTEQECKGLELCSVWARNHVIDRLMGVAKCPGILIVNGAKCETWQGFFNEIDSVFTKNLDFETGHNMNAVNDILRGGFGVHEYGEKIVVKIINLKSFDKEILDAFVDLIKNCHNDHIVLKE